MIPREKGKKLHSPVETSTAPLNPALSAAPHSHTRAGRHTHSLHRPAAAVLTPPPLRALLPACRLSASCRLSAACLRSTLSSAASECGCPIKEGSLYFSTVTYVRPLESLTCLRQPVDSNPRPYWATGAFLQGKLRSVATRQGGRSLVWKECGGSVEYSPQLPFSSTIPRAANADEYTEDDFWLRSGQMVVRLAEGHFAGRGAE